MNAKQRVHAQGFTLIELLIVITIIALLAALIVPALTSLKNRQRQLQVGQDLQGFTLAISQYLQDYGILGDEGDSADFTQRYLHFLAAVPAANDRPLYLDPDRSRIARRGGDDSVLMVSTVIDADVLLDPWGNPYDMTVVNQSIRGISSVESVLVFSHAGSTDPNPSSLGQLLVISAGEWRELSGLDVDL